MVGPIMVREWTLTDGEGVESPGRDGSMPRNSKDPISVFVLTSIYAHPYL